MMTMQVLHQAVQSRPQHQNNDGSRQRSRILHDVVQATISVFKTAIAMEHENEERTCEHENEIYLCVHMFMYIGSGLKPLW